MIALINIKYISKIIVNCDVTKIFVGDLQTALIMQRTFPFSSWIFLWDPLKAMKNFLKRCIKRQLRKLNFRQFSCAPSGALNFRFIIYEGFLRKALYFLLKLDVARLLIFNEKINLLYYFIALCCLIYAKHCHNIKIKFTFSSFHFYPWIQISITVIVIHSSRTIF